MAMALTSVSATAIPQVAAATVQPDFGLCVPAMLFEDGAFIPMDPLVGQEDSAANPSTALCDKSRPTCTILTGP
jgi:hypothetical protein